MIKVGTSNELELTLIEALIVAAARATRRSEVCSVSALRFNRDLFDVAIYWPRWGCWS